jgi:hypothetical protein
VILAAVEEVLLPEVDDGYDLEMLVGALGALENE